MRQRGKCRNKKIIAILGVILISAGLLTVCAIRAQAAFNEWDGLGYADIRNTATYDMRGDIKNFSSNQTLHTPSIYESGLRYFNRILMNDTSRLMYAKRLQVYSGETISIVAATDDTLDSGGESINSGLRFYWSIGEYDDNGNLVMDGDWRMTSESWEIGHEPNKTEYGKDGYPAGVNSDIRSSSVSYVVPAFRWNNGDLSLGAGTDYSIKPNDLYVYFPIFKIVTKPFNYTFNLNGGNINGSSGDYRMTRLGTESKPIPTTPVREGYIFAGWKITSQGGKQKGKIYTAEQLNTMFNDGKYWSSLFEDATFEAQWTPITYKVVYDNNWGNTADWGNGETNRHTQICTYDNVEHILVNKYSKDGYVFTGWNTDRDGNGIWYYPDDTFLNLTAEQDREITLFAQWGGRTRSFIEYNGMGQDSGDNYVMGYWSTNDGANYEDGSKFTKSGSNFTGWNVYRQLGQPYGKASGSTPVPNIDGITTITPKLKSNDEVICIEAVGGYHDCASVNMGKLANDDSKRFAFTWAGKDAGGDYYVIFNNAGGRVLDVNGEIMDGDSNKHDVRLRNYVEGSVFQQWYVEMTDDNGYVKLRSRWNGGYLDNFAGQLYIYAGNSNDTQKWALSWIKFNAYAQWSEDPIVNMTVNHFLMGTDGEYSDNPNTVEWSEAEGTIMNINDLIDQSIPVENAIEFDHAESDEKNNYTETDSVTVTDGKVVNIYYKRNKFKVTLNKNAAIKEVTGGGDYYYGAEVTINAKLKDNTENYRYAWSEWSSTKYGNKDRQYSFIMPAENVSLTAKGTIISNCTFDLADFKIYQGEDISYDKLLTDGIKNLKNYEPSSDKEKPVYNSADGYGAVFTITEIEASVSLLDDEEEIRSYSSINDDRLSQLAKTKDASAIGEIDGQEYIAKYRIDCTITNKDTSAAETEIKGGSYDNTSYMYIMKVDPYISATSATYYENQFYQEPSKAYNNNTYLVPMSRVLKDTRAEAYSYLTSAQVEERKAKGEQLKISGYPDTLKWGSNLTSKVVVESITYNVEDITVNDEGPATSNGIRETFTVNKTSAGTGIVHGLTMDYISTEYTGTHNVTISVTNEYGNMSKYQFNVIVNYNNEPDIYAAEKYYFVGDTIDRTSILDPDTCSAIDYEDGVITNKVVLTNTENSRIVTDEGEYDEYIIDSSKARTLVVSADVTDKYGKTDRKLIKLTIVKTIPDVVYSRSISLEYLWTLDDNSIWRLDEDRYNLLKSSLEKGRDGVISDDDCQFVFHFTGDEMKEIKSHDYWKSAEGLKEFAETYADNRIK